MTPGGKCWSQVASGNLKSRHSFRIVARRQKNHMFSLGSNSLDFDKDNTPILGILKIVWSLRVVGWHTPPPPTEHPLPTILLQTLHCQPKSWKCDQTFWHEMRNENRNDEVESCSDARSCLKRQISQSECVCFPNSMNCHVPGNTHQQIHTH